MCKTIVALATLLLSVSSLLQAADHLDAPSLSGNGQADVNDLYAFQSPTNADNTVLILTVNPFAGSASPTKFGTNIDYEFQIDNTGDAVADLTYRATFADTTTGQSVLLSNGASTLATGNTGMMVPVTGGGMMHAGLFDDPFFFDLVGFNDGFNFTGDDTLAGANVSAIVLEVPSSDLGGPNIGIWARTVSGGNQVDRIGRPAINTALIPSSRKDEFNLGSPATDFATFGGDVNATITALSSTANADALTGILLPDVLTFDTSDASGFLNGRGLTDDVIDAELNLLSAGAVTGDGVSANDVAFPQAFPYLAPQNVPEPSAVVLSLLGIVLFAGNRGRRR